MIQFKYFVGLSVFGTMKASDLVGLSVFGTMKASYLVGLSVVYVLSQEDLAKI